MNSINIQIIKNNIKKIQKNINLLENEQKRYNRKDFILSL